MRQRLEAFVAAFALFILTTSAITAAPKPDCGPQLRTAARAAAGISVSIDAPASIASGGSARIRWTSTAAFEKKRPVYIVISIPAEVRFDVPAAAPTPDAKLGDTVDIVYAKMPGFIALPPAARGPFGMATGKGTTRALIPLHMPGAKRTGTFDIRFYNAGDAVIEANVIAITACGEYRLSKETTRRLTVAPGKPEVVVQDPYDIERPQMALVSNNGRYRANIFADRYRVYDKETGARLVDRPGHEVNFSPTSRFIIASVGDKGSGLFEVIDLASREVVANPAGSFIGWTYGDAYMIAGKGSWGGLSIRPMLITRNQNTATSGAGGANGTGTRTLPSHEMGAANDLLDIEHPGSCHACASWTDDHFMLDLDNGILAYTGVFDLDQAQVYELASGAVPCCKSQREVDAFVAANYAVLPFAMKTGWHARDPIGYTHIYDASADPQAEHLADQNWFQAAKAFRDRRVAHLTIDPKAAPVRVAGLSGSSLIRGDWRAHTARGSGEAAAQTVKDRLAVELNRLGLDLAAPMPRETISFSNSWAGEDRRTGPDTTTAEYDRIDQIIDKRTSPLEKRLIEEVPAAAKHLGRHKLGGDDYVPPIPYEGLDKSTIDLTRAMEGLWRWDIDGRPVWLLQLWATEGNAGIGMGMIVLLEGNAADGPNTSAVTDLSPQLEAFWAGAYGASAHQTRLKPHLFKNRYLVAASVAQQTILVFDLITRKQIALFQNVPQADLIEEVQLSADARYVVQINSDGQFFVHDVAATGLNLLGRALDDEIIVYTPEGYYWSSYEGAHFVQLRFPGLTALFPFHQFKAVLDRPEIIKQRVAAGSTAKLPPPQLSPPPALTVTRLAAPGTEPVKLDITVRAANDLVRLKMFADARLVADIPLQGRQASLSTIPPADVGNARWLTLQAVDASGLVSVPQSLRMATAKPTQSTLHAVLVGVDSYADPAFNLAYAESDAKRFGDTLDATAGSYYGTAKVTALLGAKATRTAILDQLKSAVAAAQPSDTIVFSFAGHGVPNDDGRYYLTPADFDAGNIASSALAWADIAAVLQKTTARVVVVLDACHSGLSGSEQAGTNDDAASALLSAARAPMLVLAASKGRQFSYENPKWGGGLFTYALTQALAKDRATHDVDADGAIAVSELYRAVKAIMHANSQGQQTPWLARQDLIGDFALF